MNIGYFRSLLHKYWRDASGAFAVLFGILAMVLFMLAGAAVDFSQATSVRTKLGQALDAAALAVGASGNLTQEQAQALAEAVFNANYPADELGTPMSLTVTPNGQVISIKAKASVDTAFLGVVGFDKLYVETEAEVTREGKKVEIAMVLDNTGSMAGSKMDSLKVAAKTLVDVVFGENETVTHAKIGLVPFATAVNVGSDMWNSGWIDTNGLSSLNAQNFQATTSVWQLYQDMAASDMYWTGCVQARPNGLDVLDTPPAVTLPDTLWVPYLWPDEPDQKKNNGVPSSYSYPNNYLDDGIKKSDADTRQRDTDKYASGDPIYSGGPNKYCPSQPILPMTNVKSTLKDAIDDMTAKDTTDIPVGLAWGWRVISPDEPFTEGAAYTDDKTIKAIILLTDGDNFIGNRNNHNESDYTAYGYVADGRLGTTTSVSTAINKLDEKTTELCDNIKDKDILLYTITFQVSSTNTRDLMKNCATNDGMYFDSPTNEKLVEIFGIIAKQLSNLRLSK